MSYIFRDVMKRRKGQFYIMSAVFIIISLYLLVSHIFYDNTVSADNAPLLELYKMREISMNVDYVLAKSEDLEKSLPLLERSLQDMEAQYDLELIEFGYIYDNVAKQYNITLTIKGKYNALTKMYRLPS